ncbi:helix-hairpin-helix domain-containing protein [Streptomyces sp. NPDC060194]|uniref:helix-hairpin-helix domain-containing protein n=1 Tax=Streptomyces sp. NPDC060194 TaxID=3347069 RepID=UPI003665D34E
MGPPAGAAVPVVDESPPPVGGPPPPVEVPPRPAGAVAAREALRRAREAQELRVREEADRRAARVRAREAAGAELAERRRARDGEEGVGPEGGECRGSAAAPGLPRAHGSAAVPREDAAVLAGGDSPSAPTGRPGAHRRTRVPAVPAGERVRLLLAERLPLWVQARCGMGRRNLVALAVLLSVGTAFAVQHFWSGRPEAVRAPEVVGARAAVPAAGPEAAATGRGGPAEFGEAVVPAGGAADAPAGGSGARGARLVVDVGGKVREPGVYRLPAGSRVADALRAAGGVKAGADTGGLNRARLLVDGEQVIAGGPAAPGPPPPAGGPAAPAAGPVSLNTATVEQLDALPGVGPVLAQHILDFRTQNGGFRSLDQLREVNGIGDRRFADLKNLVQP